MVAGTYPGVIISAALRRAAWLHKLVEADMAGLGSAPCRCEVAENIRDLQSRVDISASASVGRPDLL